MNQPTPTPPNNTTRNVAIALGALAVILIGVVVVLLVTRDDNKKTAATTTTASSTTTTATTTTTVPVTTTTAPATTTTEVLPTDPAGFAQALYAAWKIGDQTAAARFATPTAVQEMFSVPYGPIQTNQGAQDPYTFEGCSGAAGSAICTYQGQDNAIQMNVRNSTGGLPIIVQEVKRTTG
jgi:hypothetical protein